MNTAIWIWEEDQVAAGPPVSAWRAAGIDRVYLKCGDGNDTWAQFAGNITQLKALGFEVWAWQYVYGMVNETAPAIAAFNNGADGFVIDAEAEWESSQPSLHAYIDPIRAVAGGKPIYLSSFGQPLVHQGMRWQAWDPLIDGYIPQVFPFAWRRSIPDAITLSLQQHLSLSLTKPLFPAAYLYDQPSTYIDPADVTTWLGHVTAGGYDATSFWRAGILDAADVDAMRAFINPPPPPPPGITLEDRVGRIEAFLDSWSQSRVGGSPVYMRPS